MANKLLPTSIQGQGLQLNVVGCRNLADKEWFSRQDPYVIVEYGSNRFRTRTDKDGGKNPTFNERFTIPLIEGLREATVHVWNSNTVSVDDFIGTARVFLEKVLSSGYDDSSWALKSKTGRTAGEVNLILHFANAKAAKEDKLHGAGQYGAGYPQAAGGYPPSGFPPAAHGQPPSYASAHAAPTGYPQAHAAQAAYPAAHAAQSGYPPAHTAQPGYPAAHAAQSGYPSAHGSTSSYAPAPTAGYPPPSYQSSHSGYPPSNYPPVSGYPPQQSSHATSHTGYPPSGYPPSGYPPSGHLTEPVRSANTSAAQPTQYPYPGASSPPPDGYPNHYGAPPGGHNSGHYPSY